MKELYLVGVAHSDRRGKDRLDALLHHISPTIIAIEYSEKRIEQCYFDPELRKSLINDYVNNLSIKETKKKVLADLITYVMDWRLFEIKSPFEYSSKHNAKIEYIDPLDSNLEDELNDIIIKFGVIDWIINNIDKVIEYDKERNDPLFYDCNWAKDEFNKNRSKLKKGEITNRLVKQVYDKDRENIMMDNIRTIYNNMGSNDRLVAIVGFGHYCFMIDELKDLNPIGFPLNKADYLIKK